ncbi:MAG: heat-shock protein [Gammaproteobacteria bacterium]|nr:heat-shock protein [Gammaproteobacteria bacterium]|tara:strand:- start:6899 stop:7351 length:453 start_codon:yes stop_codon:yes gene_type:complete
MILNFTDPFFTTRVLGFEPLFDRLQRLSESNERSSSYPPYNISKDGNLFAIEIAVAGLSKEDIQIELANGVLSVSYDGPKSELINGEDKVVYQGIAQRAFKQQFTLSEEVVVQDAELINGLLTINLEKIIPDEKKPRMIKISTPKRISNK